MAKTKRRSRMAELCISFAKRCQQSKNWQGDGWGVCWLDDKREWKIYKSLSPIWEEVDTLSNLPKIKTLLVHARSASFKEDMGIEFNQPFIKDGLAFVFNGFVSGVKLKQQIPGEIGAQKIFALINKLSAHQGFENSLKTVRTLLEENSRQIEGLNIGLCDKESFYALCKYGQNQSYYTLRFLQNDAESIVSSTDLDKLAMQQMKNGQLLKL